MRTPRSTRAVFRYSPLVAALACALAPAESQAVAYTVINTNDSGAGSLRQAITDANTNCFADSSPVVQFIIPGTGPFVIAPATPLPNFVCASGPYTPIVQATSQPGSVLNSDANG